MSGLEFNKIIASIFIAIIVFTIIGLVGNFLVNIDSNNQETAYKIDISEISSETSEQIASNQELLESITPLLINASLKNGEKISKKCMTCHNYQKEGKSKVGPNLWNIINKPKGSVKGFSYSKALMDYGGNWSFEELNRFLQNPKKYIEGSKMNFSGLKDIQDRADVILWLRQQSDNPVPLP